MTPGISRSVALLLQQEVMINQLPPYIISPLVGTVVLPGVLSGR